MKGYCKASPTIPLEPWRAEQCKKKGCEHYGEMEDEKVLLLQKSR
jgi:hypothetical protein